MWMCEQCGDVYEELPTHDEDFGYDVGIGRVSAVQTMVDSCHCGGNFVEATECDECGEYFEKNGEQSICDKCLEKYKTFDNAIKIGAEYPIKKGINQFLAWCFSEEEINQILERELREAEKLGKPFVARDIEEYFKDNEWLSGNVEGL